MVTTYYNCPVKLGLAGESAAHFFVAQSASVEESIPMLPIRSLGVSNSINAVPENTIQGSVNINFLLSFGDAGGLSSLAPSDVIGWTCINQVNPTLLDGSIGPIRFYDAVVSSFSVNADAQSVVNCSLSLNYYKHTEPMDSEGSSSENDFDGASLSYAHGANSDPDANNVALNNNLFSFSFQLSQSITPIKILGSVDPESYLKTNGELTATFVGNNLPSALARADATLCKDAVGDVSFTAMDCNGNSTIITLPQTPAIGNTEAHIVSRSIEVSENNALNGTAVITQYF
jgi:hypothetical protein